MPLSRKVLFAFAACVLAGCGGFITSKTPDSGAVAQGASASQFQVPVADDATGAGNAALPPGVTVYELGDRGANAGQVNDMRVGADGKLYYTTGPQGSIDFTSGEIGSFDFSSHAQSFRTTSYEPWSIDETPDGSVWIEEANNTSGVPTIDRDAGIGGSDTAVHIPIGPFTGPTNGLFGGLSIGDDKEMWFGAGIADYIGRIDPSDNAVKIYTLQTPSGGVSPSIAYMVLASDHRLWMTDVNNDAVFRVASSGPSAGHGTFALLPQGMSNFPFVMGIAEGSDSRIYTGSFLGNYEGYGALDSGSVSPTPDFMSIPLPTLGLAPGVLADGGNNIYFNEMHFSGLGIYNTARNALVALPLATPSFNGVAADAEGNPWVACMTAKNVACIERIVLTSKWAVFPSTSIKLFTTDFNGTSLPPGLIGIGEKGNSGPFTLKSSNTSVCTANVIPGFAHDVQVNPVKPGFCTVSITDLYWRTVNVAVKIVKGTGNSQARTRNTPFVRLPWLRQRSP